MKGAVWLVFSGALVFFNAGITVGLMDSGFNDYRKTWWLSYLHGMALVSILLIFLMLLNWVAFGPGEREFSMSISIMTAPTKYLGAFSSGFLHW